MDGNPAMAFSEKIDSISREDLNNFADKCGPDRHSFRLIISPENAHELKLKQYTRELIDRMEKDLSTKLEWVAVNHYNTDNPHTHLFIRGVNDKGNDLYIKIKPSLSCAMLDASRIQEKVHFVIHGAAPQSGPDGRLSAPGSSQRLHPPQLRIGTQ
jgi:hypothetical protein